MNYARRRVADAGLDAPAVIAEVLRGDNGVWTDDVFLLPVVDGDALLFATDFDEDDGVDGDPALRVEGSAVVPAAGAAPS